MNDQVNHPPHYGGADNVYEAIKVIDAWGLDFYLGNAVKYIARAGKKDKALTVQDLEKALWYLKKKIESIDVPLRKGKTPCGHLTYVKENPLQGKCAVCGDLFNLKHVVPV